MMRRSELGRGVRDLVPFWEIRCTQLPRFLHKDCGQPDRQEKPSALPRAPPKALSDKNTSMQVQTIARIVKTNLKPEFAPEII